MKYCEEHEGDSDCGTDADICTMTAVRSFMRVCAFERISVHSSAHMQKHEGEVLASSLWHEY
jgi:hypothetical protein